MELIRTELRIRKEAEANMDRAFDDFLHRKDGPPVEREWGLQLHLIQSERGHYMVSNLIAWLEATERRLEAIIDQA